jgi:hypothetical protein
MLDSHKTGDKLKNDCFFYLKKLSQTSLLLCDALENKTNYDPSRLLKESKLQKEQCIDYSVKTFMPPINREDIVTLSLLLHRLNINIASVIFFKNQNYPSADILKQLSGLHSAVIKADKALDNKLSLKTVNTLSNEQSYDDHPLFNNNFTTSSVISAYNLFSKIDRCENLAWQICDYLVRTAVKNS